MPNINLEHIICPVPDSVAIPRSLVLLSYQLFIQLSAAVTPSPWPFLPKTNDIQFPQLLPVQDALPASNCLNGPPLPEYQQYCSSICNNRQIHTLLSVRANPRVISNYWNPYFNVSIGGSRKMDSCFPVQQHLVSTPITALLQVFTVCNRACG